MIKSVRNAFDLPIEPVNLRYKVMQDLTRAYFENYGEKHFHDLMLNLLSTEARINGDFKQLPKSVDELMNHRPYVYDFVYQRRDEIDELIEQGKADY